MSQGEHLKALQDYSRALEIFKSIYTTNHLSVAGSYNNIGLVYTAMESHEKALAYYEEALKIRLEILHKEHPDIATSYCNIGGAYCNQGKWESALECLWKAREIRVAVYGENNAQTISTNNQIEHIVNNC